MSRRGLYIARLLVILALLTAGGGYLGYAAPWALGLRPGIDHAAYGPLVGATSGAALGVIAPLCVMVVRRLRKQPLGAALPSIDWQDLHDPVEPPQSQWPRQDWQQAHDPAAQPPGEEGPALATRPKWKEPSRLGRFLQAPLPGPRSARFIGPRLPRTLEMVAQRARNDDMHLRAESGGRLTAAEYPEVLERQWDEWREMFGEGGGPSVSQPVIIIGLAVWTLFLLGLGYIFGPKVLGFQGGAVAGASTLSHTLAPFLGMGVGIGLSAFCAWWVLFKWAGGQGGERGSKWEQAYGTARITQVEYRDDSGRLVDEHAPDSRRYVVRRMNTNLKRLAFADRQEGIFVSGKKMSKEQLFRKGEIRLETTKDLSKLTRSEELFDARPLTGLWMGVASVWWYTGLRNPIETGMAAREWEVEGESGGAGRFFTSNIGWMTLLVCVVAGIIIFFAALDHRGEINAEVREIPDRTPKVMQELQPRTPGTD